MGSYEGLDEALSLDSGDNSDFQAKSVRKWKDGKYSREEPGNIRRRRNPRVKDIQSCITAPPASIGWGLKTHHGGGGLEGAEPSSGQHKAKARAHGAERMSSTSAASLIRTSTTSGTSPTAAQCTSAATPTENARPQLPAGAQNAQCVYTSKAHNAVPHSTQGKGPRRGAPAVTGTHKNTGGTAPRRRTEERARNTPARFPSPAARTLVSSTTAAFASSTQPTAVPYGARTEIQERGRVGVYGAAPVARSVVGPHNTERRSNVRNTQQTAQARRRAPDTSSSPESPQKHPQTGFPTPPPIKSHRKDTGNTP
ncbi:hypothetical protein C8J57DRAFT_1470588 [Mycena rebaudengoi]|nr:hypothetical protein C8J57DRAFT_1470588 [Mycena rebaudengoi]